ncbi:MAG: C25 family cysteine peptidase [Candidatus Contendobacter sp.]|nr:C25 family cysteine peptidase [Candidatus Contendobacter sp.]MDG4556087.1 C25 family cysteine peptidase [Candidatus Contendobacter sp.]
MLGSRNLYLGANRPDGEADGAPGAAANGDNNAQVSGVNDEDGVASFPTSSTSAGVYTVSVAYTNNTGASARLCGWIDFDKNGTFDTDERACADANTAGASSTNLAFTVPIADRNNTCTVGSPCYARFRIASTASEAEASTGLANNGEVEDYQITNITTLPITLASVDARQSRSGLTVEWTTATETRNAGFRLYGRTTGEPDWQSLAAALIPSKVIDSLEPQRYVATFPGVQVDELLIEDWDTQGQTRRHGPFAVGRQHGFDAVAAAKPINWAAIHAENAQTLHQAKAQLYTTSAAKSPDALLWVTEPGVQRVSFGDLQAADVSFAGVAIADLALTDAGRKQPRYIIDANNNGQFDSGDTLEFLGEVTPTLYSARNAYRLSVDRSLVSEANSKSLDSKDAVPGVFDHTLKLEQQRAYSFAAPGNDPWYDEWLFAYGGPASLTRAFDLPGYVGGEARLNLRHWGVTDWPGDAPDHHLIVKVNGQQVDEARFDGSVDASRTLVLSGVQATGNTLTLEAPGDTGYDYDIQALDGFTVQYKRHTQADNGAWQGTLPTDATKTLIVGFQGESVAWRNAQRRVGGEQLIVNGQGAWVAADSRAIRRPTIQTDIPAPVAEPKGKDVDYLIITHPLFSNSPALADLVALQKGRGYRTAVVNVDAIYAAHSDFEVSADAIGRYLKQAKPSFVLLVGGDSNDYHNYLGLASQSFIPTRYAQTDALVTYAPADGWYVDYNDDGKPQAALGRLPVRTVAELSQLVPKLVHSAPPTHAVLSAGPSDDGRQFAAVSAGYAAQLPSAWSRQLIAADNQGLAAAQSDLQAALNQNGALVSYIGHSSYALWGLGSNDTLFSATLARQLTNPTPHVVTQWGCWNTYFVNPRQDTMANAFLFQPRGAAAVLGATALTDVGVLNGLGNAFFKQLGRNATLGEALQAAQRTYLNQNPAAAGSLRGFALLGDPAAQIR